MNEAGCTKCMDGDKYDGPHSCKAGEETRLWLNKKNRQSEDRRMYQGALYEDVRDAVQHIVRTMRADHGNVGKNTNMRHLDRFMVHPFTVRLYDPHCTVRPEEDWERVCACDRDCCDKHGDL